MREFIVINVSYMDIRALKSHLKLKNKNARMFVDSSVPVRHFQKQATKGHVFDYTKIWITCC